MGVEKNRSKTSVWQDIVPAKSSRVVKKSKSKTHRKKLIVIILIGITFLLLLVAVYLFVIKKDQVVLNPLMPDASTIQQTPAYATSLPSGKTVSDLGGWKRVSPPDRNPVFAYSDKIGTVSITVSQQPLPPDFNADTAKHIEQLANGFNATSKLTVGQLVVYIGTSTKGPQSLIFNKNYNLILIKSTSPIANDQWVKYISALN